MSADRATFDRAWRAFAERRLGDLAALLHPDVEWHSAPLGTVFRGVDELARWSQATARRWKSLTVVLDEVDDSADGVVAAYGTLTAFGHSGDDYEGDIACVTEYAGGRLVRGHVFGSHDDARGYVASRSTSRALAA